MNGDTPTFADIFIPSVSLVSNMQYVAAESFGFLLNVAALAFFQRSSV